MSTLRNKMSEMTEGTNEYAMAMRKLGELEDRWYSCTRKMITETSARGCIIGEWCHECGHWCGSLVPEQEKAGTNSR